MAHYMLTRRRMMTLASSKGSSSPLYIYQPGYTAWQNVEVATGTGTATFGTSNVTVKRSGTSGNGVVNLKILESTYSGYTKLVFKAKASGVNSNNKICWAYQSNHTGTTSGSIAQSVSSTSETTYTIDISGKTGTWYIVISAYLGATLTITDMHLENESSSGGGGSSSGSGESYYIYKQGSKNVVNGDMSYDLTGAEYNYSGYWMVGDCYEDGIEDPAYITFSSSSSKALDVTNYSKLCIEAAASQNYPLSGYMYAGYNNSWTNRTCNNKKDVTTTTKTVYEFDISSQSSIFIHIVNTTASEDTYRIYLYNVWLE